MFTQLRQLLFGTDAPLAGARSTSLVAERLASLPAGPPETGQRFCAFGERGLTGVYDESPPRDLRDKVWWRVPADDVPLEVVVPLVDRQQLSATVEIRFEPEMGIERLLAADDAISTADLEALVTSQLSSLLADDAAAGEEQTWPPEKVERVRARLSLLLQAYGLRCTGFGGVRVSESNDSDATVVPDTFCDASQEVQTTVANDELTGELAAVLESAGCQLGRTEVDSLAQLGAQIRDRSVSDVEATGRLRELAQAARDRAASPDADTVRTRGLALRMRLADEEDERNGEPTEITGLDPTAYPQLNELVRLAAGRRPRGWWFSNRVRIDALSHRWLAEQLAAMRAQLSAYQQRLRDVPNLVALRRASQDLDLALDLLSTVPTLEANIAEARPARDELKQRVRAMEQAATAAEAAVGSLQGLVAAPPESDSWSTALDELTAALAGLNQMLRARRARSG